VLSICATGLINLWIPCCNTILGCNTLVWSTLLEEGTRGSDLFFHPSIVGVGVP